MPENDPRNPGANQGDRIGGYRIENIIEVPEIAAFYYELFHPATGARHIHISRPDSENAFSIAFKTVPRDSTGIAHILEHTVLCGSLHYPVRDPFFSMMKRSLNTFMNALTASDWTMYPFATQNKKDFYNLLSVYLDSAFYPKLDALSFKQEGFRIEAEPDPEATDGFRLVYKGVVYNEMKGAMSSPDQVMGRSLLNAVYPDTTYSNNSGGHPAQIPRLTHEDLIAFHRHHYHPSNAFFYTYGDLAMAPHLEYIENNILKDFSRIDPETEVPSQPRWNQPKTATYTYPLDPDESPERKSQACVAWLTTDIRDSFEVLVLTVLEQILIGNPGSPLRKALMDSGLGSTLCDGTGYDAENKDTMFACGLKDVDADSAAAVEKIVFEVLTDLCENGIDRRLVDTAIHQIEFHRKEVTNSPFPYGLKLLLRFCGDWFHQGDPASALEFDSLMNRFFDELNSGPLLENRIRTYFLENSHRVRLTLEPDRELAAKESRREAEELDQIKARLSRTEIEQLQNDAEKLVQLQESEEDVSSLPTLEIEDIAKDIRIVEPSRIIDEPATYCYAQPTAGIFYYTAAIGLQPLPPDLVSLVPFFCYALTRTGTNAYDYVELARRIDQYTGGLGFSVSAGNRFTEAENMSMPMLSMSGKCLSRNIDNMFELLNQLLTGYSFSDVNRLKHLLLEIRSDLESSVIHNGHRLAISLAARNFSVSNALNETWHGIHQLKTIKELTEDLSEQRLKDLADNLYRIADALFYRNNIKTALIGEQADIDTATDRAAALYNQLGTRPLAGFDPPEFALENQMPYEGWSTSTAVSFVAKVVAAQRMDHADAPVVAVISKLLKSMFLHTEIREKGGAYGGFSVYQLESGLFYFGSYRDPHIVNTLGVYEAAADFLIHGDYDDEDIKEAILQVCADLDRPDSPGHAASKAFYRQLIGLSDDLRKQFKEQTLTVTRQRVLEVGSKYFAGHNEQSAIAVISSDEGLKSANSRLKAPLAVYRI
ncbi:MAG: insulinase family protein [Thermodesulfobacteriota bacterium]